MAEITNPITSEWTPETDPVIARVHASEPLAPEWSEFLHALEEARRETHDVYPVPLNHPDHPPTLSEAAGAFAGDAGWEGFMEEIERYREEQTRAEVARMQRKK